MTVTIIGKNEHMGFYEKYEGVDYDLVTVREIKHRKYGGFVSTEVRIKRGKRDIVLSNGCFDHITIQDEETGRYLLRLGR